VVVMTITLAQANDVVDGLGFPYSIYVDPQWDLYKAYDAGFISGCPMPAWILIDRQGSIRYLWRAHDQVMGTTYPEADDILAEVRTMLLAETDS
jgi:peroxiredoxin